MKKARERAYDPHTPAGRVEIDAAVRGALREEEEEPVARVLLLLPGMTREACSRSLRRQARKGLIRVSGKLSGTKYRAWGRGEG